MCYTFVNTKVQGELSDHQQQSCVNEKDTYSHTTGGEQRDTGGAAHTVNAHANKKLCRWETARPSFNLNLFIAV